MIISIDRALTDPNLLGSALGPAASWATWRTVLKAAFALPLSDAEHTVFHTIAGDRPPPTERVRELWGIVGRRGGKSKMAGAIAVYLACFVKHKLSPGETGHVLVLAASRDQAQTVFSYALAFLQSSPVLRQEIDSTTASTIRLTNGIEIATHANSFRSVRGRSLVAAILDETSWWRDETSATPDVEVYRAIRPSLATTNGMLIGISTPYRRVGLLHTKHRDHFGQNSDTLVVQGPSATFNPGLTPALIQQAMADDPEGSPSEWMAEFRSDLSAFLSDELIDAAIEHGRPLELPPRSKIRYAAFVDPSGGRHDAFTICIGHKEAERFVCDVVRGTRPPFDPVAVTQTYAALCKDYRISEVKGDNYSAEWAVTAFKDAGVRYKRSEQRKSDIYLECLPLFTRQQIQLPDYAPLLRELRLLERATHRSGRDTVDHGRRGSDDFANAVCGCAANAMKRGGYDTTMSWVKGPDKTDTTREWQRLSLQRHLMQN